MKKYIRTVVCFLCSFGLLVNMQAQTKSQYLKAAEKYLLNKDFHNAAFAYKQALDFSPTNPTLLYKVAESSQMNNAYTQAEQYYLQLQSLEQSKDFPELDFNLAKVQMILGNYEAAKVNLNLFTSKYDGASTEIVRESKFLMESINFSEKRILDTAKIYSIQNAGDAINTPFSDFAPYVIGDTLFYSSTRFENPKDNHSPKWNIGKVLIKDNSVNEPLGNDLNSEEYHTTNLSVTPDGKRMYYTLCKSLNMHDIQCDLYFRDIQNGVAGTGIKVPEPINMQGYTTTHPSFGTLSNGTNLLFFSSDRPNGAGKNDIWAAELKPNKTFGQPYNLKDLNTEGMEITPFFHQQSQILYYSSNFMPGFGGYDIFKSNWMNEQWVKAEQMPSPINTSYNDLYYMVASTGKTAYLASNRIGSQFINPTDEACCNDIYKIDINKLNLNTFVFDNSSRDSLYGAKIQLFSTGKKMEMTQIEPSKASYTFPLSPDNDYIAIASKPGYESDTLYFNTKNLQDFEDIEKLFYLNSSKLDLDLTTFNKRNNAPLNGTTIKIIDLDGGSKDQITQLNDHTYQLTSPINRGKRYLIIASKKGFAPDSVYLDTKTIAGTVNKISQKLFLGKGNLSDYLPIELYFDNDEPGRKSYAKTTTKTFPETFDNYYNKRWLYKDNFGAPLSGELRDLADKGISNFFDFKVKKGNDDLMAFTETLEEVLARGEDVEIVIQGFTSPLASSQYNEKLGARRVNSITNYLKKYESGVLVKYLNSGKLKIKEVSFGESKSPVDVVSSYSDLRNSVYSVSASKERRVEIVNLTVK